MLPERAVVAGLDRGFDSSSPFAALFRYASSVRTARDLRVIQEMLGRADIATTQITPTSIRAGWKKCIAGFTRAAHERNYF